MSNILCLARGSKILMANDTVKNIEDVVTGDEITSFITATDRVIRTTVDTVASSFHEITYELLLHDGRRIRLTGDHPVWIRTKGWSALEYEDVFSRYQIEVKPLFVGDDCLVYENGITFQKIREVKMHVESVQMFAISGGEQHCFFADSILVHDENLSYIQVLFNKSGQEMLIS